MTLIASISGIRGTIGGPAGEGLTPHDIVRFTSAYGTWLIESHRNKRVVVGRDARVSGELVQNLVVSTLLMMGIDVLDLNLATTPTTEMAVHDLNAGGGIIITASHNPKEWNALKLLNDQGEFISPEDGEIILQLATSQRDNFVDINHLGVRTYIENYLDEHIKKIIRLPLVHPEYISQRNFKIVVDVINSVGAIAIPRLLESLGVKNYILLNDKPDGNFAHNPEPLPEHLNELATSVIRHKADLGIAVDPDVDRLAFIMENGEPLGEEYTLICAADYVLQHSPGNTVSNLSSSMALADISQKYGCDYYPAAVGEVNVVKKMKEVQAVIGGEGNGGVIYPELHYGRDALVGIALVLSYLATSNTTLSALKATYPNYFMVKKKLSFEREMDIEKILSSVSQHYHNQTQIKIDGLKIIFEDSWVHLRKSNTEPILRIYAESKSEAQSENLIKKIMADIHETIRKHQH